MRGLPLVGVPLRQRAALDLIADAATRLPWLQGLLVVGSMADNAADALSDLDLLVIVREGEFGEAWPQRGQLRVSGELCSWDRRPDPPTEVGAHRWLTPDLVLVEALIATASSGVRLAEP